MWQHRISADLRCVLLMLFAHTEAAVRAVPLRSQEMAQINPADLSAIGELYVPVEHICDGFQEQWDNCPGQAPQNRCADSESV